MHTCNVSCFYHHCGNRCQSTSLLHFSHWQVDITVYLWWVSITLNLVRLLWRSIHGNHASRCTFIHTYIIRFAAIKSTHWHAYNWELRVCSFKRLSLQKYLYHDMVWRGAALCCLSKTSNYCVLMKQTTIVQRNLLSQPYEVIWEYATSIVNRQERTHSAP